MLSFVAGIMVAFASLSGGIGDFARTLVPFAPRASSATTTVLFGGDMMFDRTIRTIAAREGDDHIFSCIDSLLQSPDLVVANLEGPITSAASVSAGTIPGDRHNMTFTFPLSTADLLYRHNIRIVNLGNNHIGNFGTGGVIATMHALDDAGVGYFGDPLASRMATPTIRGVRIALISYNEFAGGSTKRIASTTIQQIRAARAEGRIPIVYTHWGVEYAPTAPAYIRDRAHAFVDAGAEIVIGSHPHVVEDNEVYQGKHIYYSLGNFIFDQYFNDAVSHGILLQVVFTSAGVQSVRTVPIELLRDGRSCPLIPESGEAQAFTL